MVESTDRHRVGEYPRDSVEQEWEVFLRPTATEPLRHVGSLSAPSADIAHEQATELFAEDANDVWLCPAAEVRRYSTRRLDSDAEPVTVGGDTDGEGR